MAIGSTEGSARLFPGDGKEFAPLPRDLEFKEKKNGSPVEKGSPYSYNWTLKEDCTAQGTFRFNGGLWQHLTRLWQQFFNLPRPLQQSIDEYAQKTFPLIAQANDVVSKVQEAHERFQALSDEVKNAERCLMTLPKDKTPLIELKGWIKWIGGEFSIDDSEEEDNACANACLCIEILLDSSKSPSQKLRQLQMESLHKSVVRMGETAFEKAHVPARQLARQLQAASALVADGTDVTQRLAARSEIIFTWIDDLESRRDSMESSKTVNESRRTLQAYMDLSDKSDADPFPALCACVELRIDMIERARFGLRDDIPFKRDEAARCIVESARRLRVCTELMETLDPNPVIARIISIAKVAITGVNRLGADMETGARRCLEDAIQTWTGQQVPFSNANADATKAVNSGTARGVVKALHHAISIYGRIASKPEVELGMGEEGVTPNPDEVRSMQAKVQSALREVESFRYFFLAVDRMTGSA